MLETALTLIRNHTMAEGSFFPLSLMRSKVWDSECVTQHNPAVLGQELIKHQRDLAQPDSWTKASFLVYIQSECHWWGCLRNKADSLTQDTSEAEFYPIFTFNKITPLFLLATLHLSSQRETGIRSLKIKTLHVTMR